MTVEADRTTPPRAAARADRILEVVPRLGQRIRRKMREGAVPGLSVPQFRVLRLVGHEPGIGVSAIAERLGTSVTATSGLVDRLVRAGEILRETDDAERRRIHLRLSPAGQSRIDRAEAATREWLSAEVSTLGPDDLDRLDTALDVLARLGSGGVA